MNVVWSNLRRSNAGVFQREGDLYEFGSQLYDLAECADVTDVTSPVVVPDALVGTDEIDGGVFLIEGWSPGFDWGAEDERYYRWEEDENSDYGIKRTGDFKAFGVCDDEWQKSLRNCAKGHLGTRKFALMESLAGEYGFSGILEKKDKCNC